MKFCKAGDGTPRCKYKRNLKPDLRVGCAYEGDCVYQIVEEVKA